MYLGDHLSPTLRYMREPRRDRVKQQKLLFEQDRNQGLSSACVLERVRHAIVSPRTACLWSGFIATAWLKLAIASCNRFSLYKTKARLLSVSTSWGLIASALS